MSQAEIIQLGPGMMKFRATTKKTRRNKEKLDRSASNERRRCPGSMCGIPKKQDF